MCWGHLTVAITMSNNHEEFTEPSFCFTLNSTKSIGEFIKFFIVNTIQQNLTDRYDCYISKRQKYTTNKYEQVEIIIIEDQASCLYFIERFSDIVLKHKDVQDFRCVLIKKDKVMYL
jgi:hypothetical protein